VGLGGEVEIPYAIREDGEVAVLPPGCAWIWLGSTPSVSAQPALASNVRPKSPAQIRRAVSRLRIDS